MLKLREQTCDYYKQFKLSEGPYDINYVRLAMCQNIPAPKMKKGDLQEALQYFRNCRPQSPTYNTIVAEDLLKHHENRIRFLYAQAGMGKTTTLKHICRKIAQSKMASDFPLVLFFPLREDTVASATDLEGLLKYYVAHDPSIDMDSLIRWLRDTKGKEVLFVFDGADEARNLVKGSSKSILLQLLKGKILAESSIILSSRPGVCPDLQKHRATFYEIQGFGEKAIYSYVKEFFSKDPSTAKAMISTLEDRPDLMRGAYLPMNLFIFCSIFDTSTSVFPSTMTKCYDVYTTQVFVGECNEEEKEAGFDSLLTAQSEEVKSLVSSLGELAFEGLCSSPKAFIFEENTINKIFPSYKRKMVNTFFKGLLHVYAGTVARMPKYTFNFSHATLQEFFAAHHLQQLPPEKQLSFWKEHIWDPSFAVVFRFYAGLTKLTCEGVIDCLAPEGEGCNSGALVPAKNAIATNKVDQNLLFLFHALYESRNESKTKEVMKHLNNELHFSHCSPFDTMVVSYCLSKCSHLTSLEFNRVTLSPDQLNGIFISNNGLEKFRDCTIDKLSIEGNSYRQSYVSKCISIYSIASLHYRSMYFNMNFVQLIHVLSQSNA